MRDVSPSQTTENKSAKGKYRIKDKYKKKQSDESVSAASPVSTRDVENFDDNSQ